MSSVEPLGPGRIEPRELEQEMRSSFLDYAMSVIVARALPDVRDGLKPVHRRVLYAMHEAGLQPNRARLKCARVVGDVMGSYHPHGDQAIYDTLVRLAQPFSMRYPLVDGEGIREAYRSGRGRIVMRARTHIEELRGGRTAIVVNELPYGVKKGGDEGVIKKIADLVNDKVIPEVHDVKDLSDKSGMRIQIELKREAIPQVVQNKIFKHTPLQTTFGYNAVALVDGVPKTLPLRDLLFHYLDFQREVITRRSKFELRKAEARAHVLQGYLIALDNLDAVIALIRASADPDEARAGLMETFELSEIQAQAILDLRLQRLTGLERKRIEDEYADLQERIGELRTILGDEAKGDGLIREE